MLRVKVTSVRLLLGNLYAFVNYVHGKILSFCKELLKLGRGWGYSSVVECLPAMHKVLDSIPRTTKTKTTNNNNKNLEIYYFLPYL
jgi:hypothetical protein